MTIPEQAVLAATAIIRAHDTEQWGEDGGDEIYEDLVTRMLTVAAPHLAAVRVNVDEIVQPLEDIHAPGGLCRWTDVATAIGEVRRALRSLEPSATRELALEEIIALCRDYGEDSQPDSEYRLACNDIIEAIQERRSLSSPDHADAGKVEGDGVERTEFNRGYVLACANIVNLHGADVAVMEGFAQLGISKAELKALDLCEYDQRAIDALEDYFGADKLYLPSAPAPEGAE